MKTILFLSPTGTFDNGAEISIFNLMKELSRRGNQIINVFPKSNHQNQQLYIKRCRKNNIFPQQLDCVKWWWEEAPGALIGTSEERSASYRSNIGEIRALIKEKQVDLVITNTVNIFQGAVAAALETIPHYWLIHEFPENEFAYYLKKIDFIDAFSAEIYSVTGELNQTLTGLFPNRKIKAFAPYSEIYDSELKEGKQTRIVSVGRISKRKNQLELIKAYEQLNRPEIELVFIGAWDSDYKEICQTYIKEHKLKNITFTGNLASPWDEVTAKDIAVFPSAMETFGLVYVEALLKGVPVILSDNPGHRSAYEFFQFGEMYKTNDISALTKKIQFFLTNFENQKESAIAHRPIAEKRYRLEILSADLLNDIDASITVPNNNIIYLADLLSTNESKSFLTRSETKLRRFINRVRYRLTKR